MYTLHITVEDIKLNHSWRYKGNQTERQDEKPRYQMQFFQNLDTFCI